MTKVKETTQVEDIKPVRPALTPEARENQLINWATDLVEKRLREGTASSQETTHFLKLGSVKSRLEIEKLRAETELIKAKKELAESQKNSDEMFREAIEAMKRYGGHADEEEYYDDY